MAIAFRASASNATASGTSITISKPTGTVNDDIMLATVYVNDVTPIPNITPPSGWNVIGSQTTSGLWSATAVFYWRRASSEGSSYNWTIDQTSRFTGTIQSFSGCVTSGSPIDTYSLNLSAANATSHGAAITTTVADTMIVWQGAVDGATDHTWTAPTLSGADMSVGVESNSAGECVGFYRAFASTGATGTLSASTVASANVSICLLALKPFIDTSLTYRANAQTNTAGGTSLICNKPTGTVDGDIMVAVLHLNSGFSAIQVPSGWSLVGNSGADANFTADIYVYWKRASSEGTTYTWSWTGSVRATLCVLSYYNCVASGSPIEADVNTEIDNSTDWTNLTHNVPAITTTTAGTKAIYVYGGDASVARATTSMTSGWTQRIKTETGSEIVVYDKAYATATTTDAPSYVTATTSTYAGNLLFALKSVSGGNQNFFLFFF